MGRSPLRSLGRAVETTMGAVFLVIAVVGSALLPLTTSGYVRAVVQAVHAPALAEIGAGATLEAAESVRLFVVERDAPSLPAVIGGQAAFDEQAVSHLLDVRRVLIPARDAAIGVLVVVALWLLARTRAREGKAIVSRALGVAGGVLLGAMLSVTVWGMLDFDALFTAFHGLFFDPGTWVFPADAMLIKILPLPFWMTAGATWAGLIVLGAVLLLVARKRILSTLNRDSTQADSV